MAERNESQSGAQPGLLFDDLSNDGAVTRVESIEVPTDDSLAKILADVQASSVCGACKAGMPVVFGEGPSQAELMIIGEGPGVDDIHSGLPFQGQAGMLLNKMLAAINLARSECYLCNVIMHSSRRAEVFGRRDRRLPPVPAATDSGGQPARHLGAGRARRADVAQVEEDHFGVAWTSLQAAVE